MTRRVVNLIAFLGSLGFAYSNAVLLWDIRTSTGFAFSNSTLYIPGWIMKASLGTALTLSLLTALFILIGALFHHRPVPGMCHGCGYDLRATPGRCPECGNVARKVNLSPCRGSTTA